LNQWKANASHTAKWFDSTRRDAITIDWLRTSRRKFDGEGNDIVKRKSKKQVRQKIAPLNLAGMKPEDVLRKMLATPPPRKNKN